MGEGGAPPGQARPDMSEDEANSAIISYLRRKGFDKVIAAFSSELDQRAGRAPAPPAAPAAPAPVPARTLAASNAPRAPASAGNPPGILTAAEQAAAEALARDPSDSARGFAQLLAWVQGSLELYQPELLPVLLPVFAHAYLDLVRRAQSDAAKDFYETYAAPLMVDSRARHLLPLLRAATLPQHLLPPDGNPLNPSTAVSGSVALQFQAERYVLKLTRSTFALLLSWLTDGLGPIAASTQPATWSADPAAAELSPDQMQRARAQVLRILNDRTRIELLDQEPWEVPPATLHEGTGLLGFPLPPATGGKAPLAASETDVVKDLNQRPLLKLHPLVPLPERLREEVQKELLISDWASREQNPPTPTEDEKPPLPTDPSEVDLDTAPPTSTGLEPASVADLLPLPTGYRVADVNREVAKVLDARKALKFSALPAGDDSGTTRAGSSALPSVCAYTYFDADDGITASTFSQDATLMAAGFEESYVQLWSLKGEPLRRLRSDFDLAQVRDSKSLRAQREPSTRATRKLIGHSGPVYSVDFDPLAGSAAPPHYLLSGSADGTARLWNLETYSAVVAYKGHELPVWQAKWGPLGMYFATASADRTARLWSTERVHPLRIYAGHGSDVECVDFHPNSLYLATGSADRTCRLWDVQRGTGVRLFVGHASGVSCVKVSPDGRYLASAGWGDGFWRAASAAAVAGEDTAISLWDLGSGRRIKTMWGHTASVHAMDFSRDGTLLVSAAGDGTVRCWDVLHAGGKRGKLEEESNPVKTGGLAEGMGASENAPARMWVKTSSADCLATWFTRQTSMLDVHFTPRNLCLVAGCHDPAL